MWNWTPTCQQAFKAIKDALTGTPVLFRPDFAKPYIVQTD